MSPIPLEKMRALAKDAGFVATVDALYAALDARIAARQPCCTNKGLCCNFESFGHKLFVTPVELAYFIAKSTQRPSAQPDPGSCPYQIDGKCTTRDARPTGCRIFFCELASQAWQSPETEAILDEIKALHARFDLPYAYVEWLYALRIICESNAPPAKYSV